MELRKLRETVQEKRNRDDVAAQIAQLQADQDYIAMMADIDLDADSEDGEEADE